MSELPPQRVRLFFWLTACDRHLGENREEAHRAYLRMCDEWVEGRAEDEWVYTEEKP